MKYVVVREESNGMLEKIGEGSDIYEAIEIRESVILNNASVSSIMIFKVVELAIVESES